jgi:pimeloyl-ACP methyl ester carboxylesterase
MRQTWKHILTLLTLFTLTTGETLMSQTPQAKNIVLVHGAFADGSSWSKVIPLLQAKGYKVTAVSNPLTSFQEDVAETKRAIDAQDGPVILVGHSYGGVVITEAGNDPKVVGLVYVAAFAPDAGQSIVDISKNFPKPIGLEKVSPMPDGFLLLTADGIDTGFAQDLTKEEKALLFAVQPQTSGSIFAAQPTQAAWHHKPSWYVVASNDHMISPEQEVSMAKQLKATTTTLPSSHVAMLSHPTEVANVIEAAAVGAGVSEAAAVGAR